LVDFGEGGLVAGAAKDLMSPRWWKTLEAEALPDIQDMRVSWLASHGSGYDGARLSLAENAEGAFVAVKVGLLKNFSEAAPVAGVRLLLDGSQAQSCHDVSVDPVTGEYECSRLDGLKLATVHDAIDWWEVMLFGATPEGQPCDVTLVVFPSLGQTVGRYAMGWRGANAFTSIEATLVSREEFFGALSKINQFVG
jgi:hypothetical protein